MKLDEFTTTSSSRGPSFLPSLPYLFEATKPLDRPLMFYHFHPPFFLDMPTFYSNLLDYVHVFKNPNKRKE